MPALRCHQSAMPPHRLFHRMFWHDNQALITAKGMYRVVFSLK